jgi:hypothetical protein
MKLTYTIPLLIVLLTASATGYSQKMDSLAKLDKRFSKNFAMRNAHYSASYKAAGGRSDAGGFGRFFLSFFHLSRDGGDGKTGHPGPALRVKVSAVPLGDSVILVITILKGGSKEADRYYVNPRHGKIFISAEGGDGGDGGDGEDGSSGGDGGNGADGGPGGTIYVALDTSAVAYANSPCIVYFNSGGRGGKGGNGGRSSGNGSSEGRFGNDGGRGMSGPAIHVTDISGKTLWIVGAGS